jgi:diacylglycerol O-acyltransferase / wax synthase
MTAAPEQHLSALDATFLELEDVDPSAHMHIGAVLVFEGAAPTEAELLDRVRERLPALPRLRQRLTDVRSGPLHRPAWAPPDEIDPAAHITRAALPEPADDLQLLRWAGGFFSQRLDRRRPLWEAVVIDGLEGGRWALASKMHHCLADGIGSIEVLKLWADGADAIPADPPAASSQPGPLDFLRAGAGLIRHPRRTLEHSGALAEVIVREELRSSATCSLNGPIGTRRRLAAVDAELAGLKAVKRVLGGTVNDVVLAAVTTGLRDLLVSRGETPPEAGLRAMVPVSIRPDAARAAMGNRILSLFVGLPVAEPDPFARYETIRAQTAGAKHSHQPVGTETLLATGEWLPPVLHVPFAQSLFGKRLFNVTVTNVPGPQMEVRVLGARLVRAVPLVPLAADHAVGVAVLSYDGRVTFGVNADLDTVPDVDAVTAGIRQGLADLTALSAAGEHGRALAS